MPRKVKEWIGKTDDTMPPPSVRLRIFEKHGGRCRLTGKWQRERNIKASYIKFIDESARRIPLEPAK